MSTSELTENLSGLPCPCGKSSDAFCVYADTGWGKCFSGNCDKDKWSPDMMEREGYDPLAQAPNSKSKKEHTYLPNRNSQGSNEKIKTVFDRGITRATLDRYGVIATRTKSVFNITDPQGQPHAVKTRHYPKTWEVKGQIKGAGLWGREAFPAGSAQMITVTEGYEDAMAVFQMQGSKYPAVSVHSSATALADMRADFEYLNSFKHVVLCLDNDEAGRKAADRILSKLPFPAGKLKVLWLRDGKDASEYLEDGREQQFGEEWWKAENYRPDGLVFGSDLWDDIISEDDYFMIDYPFEGLNKMTYGMRTSELVLLHAPPKIGKTTIVKHIEYKLLTDPVLKEKNYGVGFLHFEETKKETGRGLISIHNGVPYHLPDVAKPEEDIRAAYDEILNNERVILYDHFGSNSVDTVLDKVRHMVAMGCKYIMIDHLSIIVSDQSGDERKQLDEILTKLKTMTMELDIAVIAVIHENRAGGIRGTMAGEQLANIVIAIEREKMDPDPWRSNVTKISVTDNRFCGRCGAAAYVHYDDGTARLTELNLDQIAIYESGGSDGGDD